MKYVDFLFLYDNLEAGVTYTIGINTDDSVDYTVHDLDEIYDLMRQCNKEGYVIDVELFVNTAEITIEDQ